MNTSEEKWEVKEIPEEEINVPDRLQDIGKKIGEYRDIVVKEFKNMEFCSWKNRSRIHS